MPRYCDATPALDRKSRCKQLDQQRMGFRRAIEGYTEQRQLHVELADYPDLIAVNTLLPGWREPRRSAPPGR